jgi:hypothetical protein
MSSAASIPAAKAPAAKAPAAKATTVVFTAARAHSLASEKAARECATAKLVPCTFCAGTGKATITVETFGVAGSAHPVSLPCCYCKNGLIKNTAELYNSYIWCESPEHYASGSTYAPDGHKVFGNTTYLCRCCGLVSQFG